MSNVPKTTVQAVGTLALMVVLGVFLVIVFCSCVGLMFTQLEGSN